jgi:hypothetical protein
MMRMQPFERVERPNTVSGLNAKRDELIRYRQSLEAEIRKVTCDIDHVEAAIRLFQPDSALMAFKAYIVQHRAKKGTVKRFILGMIREAQGPLTTLQITEAWIAARGLQCDEQTRIVIRKRIGAALISLRNAGTLTNDGKGEDGYRAWVVA